MFKAVKTNLKLLLRFLVPPLCIACEQEIDEGLLCGDCYDMIQIVAPPFCQGCGRPLSTGDSCRACVRHRPDFDRLRAWAVFAPPVDKIIHAFKYGNRQSLARLLGRSMARVLESDTILATADRVVPVPLHKGRQRDRGYNQALLLSRVVSLESAQPVLDCLVRTRDTPTQTKLTDGDRRDNVAGAFRLRDDAIVTGKSLLLIDDVMTTGATLNECASVLKQAGARSVGALVSAIAR